VGEFSLKQPRAWLLFVLVLAALLIICASSSRSLPGPADKPASTGSEKPVNATQTTAKPAAPTATATQRGAPAGTPPPLGAARVYTDGMTGLFVPAGDFLMGAREDDPDIFWPDERPQHKVYLDAFWIDKTEVTNAMYAHCVQAGACAPPARTSSYKRDSYFGVSQFDNYPVIYITSVAAAQRYCQWAGRRLPTEAEWEKAARGTTGQKYSWGSKPPDATRGNFNDMGDTTWVGSYGAGASPYGALDMAGNVWEWVSDLYEAGYYSHSPEQNPTGPTLGNSHLVRGGLWSVTQRSALSSERTGYGYRATEDRTGIRCARSQ
jgi:eukaryotic-like serine/threonine-protein kinase